MSKYRAVTQFIVCYVIIGELKFNPLKLCNMDQKSVSRLFDLRFQEASNSKPAFHYLVMQSVIEGEYGRIVFQCVGQIDATTMQVYSGFVETSGESLENLFDLRVKETQFFLQLIPMFHPKIKLQDEVPFAPPSES